MWFREHSPTRKGINVRPLIISVGFFCVLAFAAPTPSERAQAVGGWSKVPVTDEGVVDASRFAVNAQQRAIAAAGNSETITLVKILNAQHQVVQGMNYRLALRVKVGDSVKTAEAEVWARVWLKGDEQYKLTLWKFAEDKRSHSGVARTPAE